MFLKRFELKNFRKFGSENNIVEFVNAERYQNNKRDGVNLAPTTTLIVGKNNSGKTTIIKALDKLINERKFEVNDFNFSYLRNKLIEYQKEFSNPIITVEPPLLEFILTIGIEEESKDLITNLVPFMTLNNVDNSELNILIKYELEERQIFQESVFELLNEESKNFSLKFNKFVELIRKSTDYKIRYFNSSEQKIQFKIEDLIEIKTVKANNIENDKSLSKAFSKIVEYRYKSFQGKNDKKELESNIEEINSQLDSIIAINHSKSINNSLAAIESSEKLEMVLSADLSFNKLISSLIKYEYLEQGHNIPESQFGLGYTNLMMIIAELIEYMEKYPENSFNSKVNLISIEEPETFMHPQMQELFIKHINEAISSLLEDKQKNINSQLIITTHSSHILNSKIHSGNTFDNINYITTKKNNSHVITLDDSKIAPKLKSGENTDEDNLKFLKKHIKYKVSELFFSDAIIFVEGITEETLLRFYIDNHKTLNKYYLSIFNINGAHGLVYHNLIQQLNVPSLIITDLDIERSEDEKNGFIQLTSIEGRKTTNKTLIEYNENNSVLNKLSEKIEKDNIRVSYQGEINGYYATSFEEAFILTNYNNSIVKDTISKLKPKILSDIVGTHEDIDQIKKNSYKLQRKLSDSKSDFSNQLLYKLITANKDIEIPVLPSYILNGLEWLSDKLKGGLK